MVALQIRDVPEPLRDRLSALASQRGQSLQTFLFNLVSDEARRADNIAVLQQFGPEAVSGANLSRSSISDALHAERADRDATLSPSAGEQ